MRFYSQKIFPLLMDWSMSDPVLCEYRKQVLSEVTGEVLEIGFGTGLNLSYYPQKIQKVTAIDANPGMNKLAQKRINDLNISVDYRVLNGEKLPFSDRSFDSVISTWTLCSIAKVEQAIAEIYRVLKPGGKFFFIEHGLSDEPNIQLWQNRLTPLQKIIGDGCHLNRNINKIVEQQFKKLSIEQFYTPNFPKVIGYMYKGIATK